MGAEVVKALKTIARAKMLRSTGPTDEKETGRESKNGTNFRPYLRSSTERVCLDSGSDQVMRPLFESETEEGLIEVRVELATGKNRRDESKCKRVIDMPGWCPGDCALCITP